MNRQIKTEAIVLKKRPLLNKDKLVTLFSRQFGKLSLTAKGVKKITSRRLPHLETANLIRADIYNKSDHFYLQGSSLISGFYKIKQKPEKYRYIYRALYILDRLLPENQPEEILYRKTKKLLVDISEQERSREIFQVFAQKTMSLLGYLNPEASEKDINQKLQEVIVEKTNSFLL